VTDVRSPAAPSRADAADRCVLVACACRCAALLRPCARRPCYGDALANS